MADDNFPRFRRPAEDDPRGQARAPRERESAPGRGGDPLAELARLIGQHDPFAEFGRVAGQRGTQPTPQVPYQDPAPHDHGQHHDPRYGDARPDYADPRYAAPDASQPYAQPAHGQTPPYDAPVAANYARHVPGQAPGYDHQGGAPDRGAYDPAPGDDARAYAQGYRQDYRQDYPQDYQQEYRHPYPPDDRQVAGAPAHQGYEVPYNPAAAPFDRAPGEYAQDPMSAHASDADERAPRRSRGGLAVIFAVLGLAVIGTAAAFGYRSYFGGTAGAPPVIKADPTPSKIVPAAQNSLSARRAGPTDAIGERTQPERVVSREEQPVAVQGAPRAATSQPAIAGRNMAAVPPLIGLQPPAGSAAAAGPMTSSPAPGVNEPRRVRTVPIRQDAAANGAPAPEAGNRAAVAAREPAARPRPAPTSASASGPLSLAPQSQGDAARLAAAPTRAQPAERAGYYVQVSAQRSEDEAQASFRQLQGKFPNLLGNRSAIVRRRDAGNRGVYFGAQVGPFAGRDQANQLCDGLKSQGGTCLVLRH